MFGKDFKTVMRNLVTESFRTYCGELSDGGGLEGSPAGDMVGDHGEPLSIRSRQHVLGQQRASRHQLHAKTLEIVKDKKDQV